MLFGAIKIASGFEATTLHVRVQVGGHVGGAMVAPGAYRVSLSRRVRGTVTAIGPVVASELRAAPVSGFQGLMRLQDALQRIAAVRQATVEAYSQGEARLRLELSANVDSDEIADGLTTGLGQSAMVQEASEEERSITIAFG